MSRVDKGEGARVIGLEETGPVWGTSTLNQMRAKRLMSDFRLEGRSITPTTDGDSL